MFLGIAVAFFKVIFLTFYDREKCDLWITHLITFQIILIQIKSLHPKFAITSVERPKQWNMKQEKPNNEKAFSRSNLLLLLLFAFALYNDYLDYFWETKQRNMCKAFGSLSCWHDINFLVFSQQLLVSLYQENMTGT